MQRGLFALYLLTPFAGVATFADSPLAPDKPAVLSDIERQKQLVERDRFSDESQKYQDLGKFSEAAAAAEKMVAIDRRVFGDVNEDVAGSLERIAKCQMGREDFVTARKVQEEALSIRLKLYGEHDYRTTDARRSLRVLDSWARLAPKDRHELLEADHLSSQVSALYGKGDSRKALPLAQRALEIRRRILGDEHSETAASLSWLAYLYEEMGDYAKAEPVARHSVEITKKVFGDDHPNYAICVSNLAELYKDQGKYAKAEPLYRQALEIRRKVLGESHKDFASSLSELAGLYVHQGNYAGAELLLKQTLEIQKKTLGESNRDYSANLYKLGAVYEIQGRYSLAEPLFQRSLAIDKNVLGEAHPNYAVGLSSLAGLYQSQGDYARAEPLYRQALQIQKDALGETHPSYARTLNTLATLYKAQGNYAGAEALYRQAVEIKKKVLGEAHPDYATSLSDVAVLYDVEGKYAQAEPLLRHATEIYKKALGESHPHFAVSLNNLAKFYESQGDFAHAEVLMRQALEIRRKAFGEIHPDYSDSLYGLAMLYQSQGDFTRAEPLYQQALAIRKKTLGEAHPHYADTLSGLGRLYESKGDYARAELLLRQAISIYKKTLGEAHPYYARSLNNLAQLYKSQGDYARAEPLLQQTLAMKKKSLLDRQPTYALSLDNLAALYRLQGDDARAEPPCRQALEIYERHFAMTLGIQSEQQQLALAQNLRGDLDLYLNVTHGARVQDAAVYRHVLSWKGAVFMRQFAGRTARSPELRPLFDQLQSLSVRLSNLALQVPNVRKRAAWRRDISELNDQKEALERDLSSKSAAFREQRTVLEPTPEDLEKALPEKAALVDMLEYTYASPSAKKGRFDVERRLVAFVVRNGAEVRRIELGPVAPVAKAINEWRQTYGRPGASSPGSELRARIWEPLEPVLAGAETILFSPDGALCRFPLTALPGSRPRSYLIEERNIVVVPVPRLVPQILAAAATQSADGPERTPLLIGDVDFGSEPGLGLLAKNDRGMTVSQSRSAVRGDANLVFSPLPGTAHEIEGIRALYRQRFAGREPQLISGSKATEQAFRTEASHHRWIHVATHGFFAPETIPSALDTQERNQSGGLLSEKVTDVRVIQPGLLSGIALAGANRKAGAEASAAPGAETEPDDGILTALEVEGLDLANVDLVVLSACETGLGKSAGGEGVLGLQRAFQLAGAKTCVTSLWKVDDTATQVLMQEFYGNLWGIDPATKKPRKKLGMLEALKQAQLRMLRDYEPSQKKLRGLDIPAEAANVPERGSPFYWAAFALSGDWR